VNNLKKIAVAAAVLCSSIGAQAQEINPSWYIQPSINASKPDSDFSSDKTGYGAGLRFGKPVSPQWDVQFGTTYSRSKDNGNRYQQNTLGVDGLYFFNRNPGFSPFAVIGAGMQRDKDNGPFGERSKSSPYANLVLGFQSKLTDQWSTQLDVRNVHGFLRGNTFPQSKSSNWYVNVGLNYAFDKPPVAAQPAPPPPVREEVVVVPPPPPPPPPAPRFEKVTMAATELFAFDSAKLAPTQTKLDEIARVLNAAPDVNNVVISGYADRIGSAKYNQKLSQQRADSVKEYLVAKGVASNRLSAEGKGSTNPVVTCDNKKRVDLIKCLEPNRRVEVEQITIERRVR
jgi:OOP family OmpA-OmpF porin